jgi:GTP-binding protein
MLEQAQIAIDSADVVLFVADVKSGVTEGDRLAADILRRSKKPVICAVNKCDTAAMDAGMYEFYELSLGTVVAVSAEQALGIGDLLDEVVAHFPETEDGDDENEILRVAIVGKPNVGKSSLVNKLLGENRVIVSDVPGTTRDAVDTYINKNGNEFILIDTAGIRRKSKIKEDLEKFSIMRAVAAIERCHVCVLIISAEDGYTEQDAKIAGIAHERGKAAVIAVNKWDTVEKETNTHKRFEEEIRSGMKYMSYAPMVFISAKSGQRVYNVLDLAVTAAFNNAMRIATGTLNEVLAEAVAHREPPQDKGRQLRVYYGTQASVRPPTFVLFVNDPELMHFSYKRYLENQIRKAFGFVGTPIHFVVRGREDR